MQIQNILSDFKDGLTAKEISVEMQKRGYANTSEINLSAPRLKEKLKQESQVMNKIKKLPTAKKHELGII